MVVAGIGQMFVITLSPDNVDLSLPANIGLANAVAMTVMGGSDAMIAPGLLAALGCVAAIGAANYALLAARGDRPVPYGRPSIPSMIPATRSAALDHIHRG